MEPTQNPIVEQVILAFDICSSSSIIEDLTLTGRFGEWQRFLTEIKETVGKRRLFSGPRPYKFTGDGWLIMFPMSTSGNTFFGYVSDLAATFQRRYESSIVPILENPPAISGVTFGADVGRMLTIDFLGSPEYVGRPINIACRLMNAIKDRDPDPGYKILMSRPLYTMLSPTITAPELRFNFKEVTRSLRNIRGGEEYRCVLADVDPSTLGGTDEE